MGGFVSSRRHPSLRWWGWTIDVVTVGRFDERTNVSHRIGRSVLVADMVNHVVVVVVVVVVCAVDWMVEANGNGFFGVGRWYGMYLHTGSWVVIFFGGSGPDRSKLDRGRSGTGGTGGGRKMATYSK